MAIQITTQSDSSQALRDLANLNKSLNKVSTASATTSKQIGSISGAKTSSELGKITGAANKADGAVKQLSSNYKGLIATIGSTIAVTSAAFGLTKLSDNITNINNRLKVTSDTTKEFNKSLIDTRKLALQTGTPLEGIANIYSKVAFAGKRFNVTQKQTARFTSSVAKALSISGASAQEANSAIIQLGQGLGSNNLAGEELKAILESAPFLAREIAKGMGIPFERLRKDAAAGRLTYETVVNAVLKRTDEIDNRFAKVSFTYSRAFKNLGTALSALFAESMEAISGSSKGLPNIIKEFADDIYASIDRITLRLSYFTARFKGFFYNVRDTLLGMANIVVDFGALNGAVSAFNGVKNAFNSTIHQLGKGNLGGVLELTNQGLTEAAKLSTEFFKALDPKNILSTLTSLNRVTGGNKEFGFFLNAINQTDTLKELMTQLSSHELFHMLRNPGAISGLSAIGNQFGLEELPTQMRNTVQKIYAELLTGNTRSIKEGRDFVESQFTTFLASLNLEELKKTSPKFAEVIETYTGLISEGIKSGLDILQPFLGKASPDVLLKKAEELFKGDDTILGIIKAKLANDQEDVKQVQFFLASSEAAMSNFGDGVFTNASYRVAENGQEFGGVFQRVNASNEAAVKGTLERLGSATKDAADSVTNEITSFVKGSIDDILNKLAQASNPVNFLTNSVVLSLFSTLKEGSASAGESISSVLGALKQLAAEQGIDIDSIKSGVKQLEVYSTLLEKVAENANFGEGEDSFRRIRSALTLTNTLLDTTTDALNLSSDDVLERLTNSAIKHSPDFMKSIDQYTRGMRAVKTVENFFGAEAATRIDGVLKNLSLLGEYSAENVDIFARLDPSITAEHLNEFTKMWGAANQQLIDERKDAAHELHKVDVNSFDIFNRLYDGVKGDSLFDKILNVADLKARIADTQQAIKQSFEGNEVEASIISTGLALQTVEGLGTVIDGFSTNSKRAFKEVKGFQIRFVKDIVGDLTKTVGSAFGVTEDYMNDLGILFEDMMGVPTSLSTSASTVINRVGEMAENTGDFIDEMPDFFDNIFSDSKAEAFVKAVTGTFDSLKNGLSGFFEIFGSFSIEPLFNFTLIDKIQDRLGDLASSIGSLFSPTTSTDFALTGILRTGEDALVSIKDLIAGLFNFDDNKFVNAIEKVGNSFQKMFETVGTALSEIGNFGEAIGESISRLFSKEAGSAFLQAFIGTIGAIFGYIGSLFSTFSVDTIIKSFKDLYKGIIDGFKNGLMVALSDNLVTETGRRIANALGLRSLNSTLTSVESLDGRDIDFANQAEGGGGLGVQRNSFFKPFFYDQFMSLPEKIREGLSKTVLAAFGAAIVIGLSFKSVGGGALALFKKSLALAVAAAFVSGDAANGLTSLVKGSFGVVLSLFSSFFTEMPIAIGAALALRIGLAFQPVRDSVSNFLSSIAKLPSTLGTGFSDNLQNGVNNRALAQISTEQDEVTLRSKDIEELRRALTADRKRISSGLISQNLKDGKILTTEQLAAGVRKGTYSGSSAQFEAIADLNSRIAKNGEELVALGRRSTDLSERKNLAKTERERFAENRKTRRNNLANVASGVGSILGLGGALFITQMEGFATAIEKVVRVIGFTGKAVSNMTYILTTGLLVTLPGILSATFSTIAGLGASLLLKYVAPLVFLVMRPFLLIAGVVGLVAGAFSYLALSILPGSTVYKGIAAIGVGLTAAVSTIARVVQVLLDPAALFESIKNFSVVELFGNLGSVASKLSVQLQNLANIPAIAKTALGAKFIALSDAIQPVLNAITAFGKSLQSAIVFFKIFGTDTLEESVKGLGVAIITMIAYFKLVGKVSLPSVNVTETVSSLKDFRKNLKKTLFQNSTFLAKRNQTQIATENNAQYKAVTQAMKANASLINTSLLKLYMNGAKGSVADLSNQARTQGGWGVHSQGTAVVEGFRDLRTALLKQDSLQNTLKGNSQRLQDATSNLIRLQEKSAAARARISESARNAGRGAGRIVGTAAAIALPFTGISNKLSELTGISNATTSMLVTLTAMAVIPAAIGALGAFLVSGIGAAILVGAAFLIGNWKPLAEDVSASVESARLPEYQGGTETPVETLGNIASEYVEREMGRWDAIIEADYLSFAGWNTFIRSIIAGTIDDFVTTIGVLVASFDAVITFFQNFSWQNFGKAFIGVAAKVPASPIVPPVVVKVPPNPVASPVEVKVPATTAPELSPLRRDDPFRPEYAFFQKAAQYTALPPLLPPSDDEELVGSAMGQFVAISTFHLKEMSAQVKTVATDTIAKTGQILADAKPLPVEPKLPKIDLSNYVKATEGVEGFDPYRKNLLKIQQDLELAARIGLEILKPNSADEKKDLERQKGLVLARVTENFDFINKRTQADPYATPSIDAAESKSASMIGSAKDLAVEVNRIFTTSANVVEGAKRAIKYLTSEALGFFKDPSIFATNGIEPQTLEKWQESISRVFTDFTEDAFAPVSLSLLKDFKLKDGAFDDYIERLEKIKKLDTLAKGTEVGTDANESYKKALKKQLDDLNVWLEETKRDVDTIKLLGDGKSLGKFSKVVQDMQKIFPTLNVSMEDLLAIPLEFRDSVARQADEYTKALSDLSETDAGSAEAVAIRAKLSEDSRRNAEDTMRTLLLNYRNSFEGLTAGLAEIGVEGFDKDTFRGMTESTKAFAKNVIASVNAALLKVDKNEIDESSKMFVLELTDKVAANLSDILAVENSIAEAGTSFATSVKETFSSSIVNVLTGEESSFTSFLKGLVDNFTSSVINTFVDGFTEQLLGSESALGGLFAKLGSSLSGESSLLGKKANESIAGNESLSAVTLALDNSISLQTADLTRELVLLGERLQASLSTVLGNVSATTANDIFYENPNMSKVEGFIPEATNVLGGSDELSAIEGQTDVNSAGFTFMGKTFDIGAGQIVGAIGGLAGAFAAAESGNNFGAILGIATTALSLFGTGMATGGPVIGPGSGTSDDIPVWLSNGEYVINAKAAKANRGLLDSINFGGAKKYATGGLIGNTPSIAMPLSSNNTTSVKETAQNRVEVTNVFQVTGDISRQTKSEILKLGGEISGIVYNNFKEKRLLS